LKERKIANQIIFYVMIFVK